MEDIKHPSEPMANPGLDPFWTSEQPHSIPHKIHVALEVLRLTTPFVSNPDSFQPGTRIDLEDFEHRLRNDAADVLTKYLRQ